MTLTQLIYVSNATRQLDDAALAAILASSVRHNATNGLTGMLLYSAGSFIQVLEGEEEAIEETMARINQDPRHTSIIVLAKSSLREREFKAWHMGFRALTPADAAAWPAYASFFSQGFDPASIMKKEGLALDILRNFADTNR